MISVRFFRDFCRLAIFVSFAYDADDKPVLLIYHEMQSSAMSKIDSHALVFVSFACYYHSQRPACAWIELLIADHMLAR